MPIQPGTDGDDLTRITIGGTNYNISGSDVYVWAEAGNNAIIPASKLGNDSSANRFLKDSGTPLLGANWVDIILSDISVTGNAGKIVKVNDNGNALEYSIGTDLQILEAYEYLDPLTMTNIVGTRWVAKPTTITVVANPGGPNVDNLTTITIGNTDYNISGSVFANPTGTDGDDLTRITIGSTNYNIPSGGGNVVANPGGPNVNNLTTITIGNISYNIPSGTIVFANPTGTDGDDLTRISIGGTNYNIAGSVDLQLSNISVTGNAGRIVKVSNAGGALEFSIGSDSQILESFDDGLDPLTLENIIGTRWVDKPSIVIANPTGTSGDDLTRITIGNTNYNIPSASTFIGLTDTPNSFPSVSDAPNRVVGFIARLSDPNDPSSAFIVNMELVDPISQRYIYELNAMPSSFGTVGQILEMNSLG